MSTSAQTAANRANSLRSTGPRTPEGRAISALNARRHGLASERHAVLPNESSEEFEQLLADLRNDLQPVGAVETMLVHQVSEGEWRRRRAAAFEVGAMVQEGADDTGAGLAVWRDAQPGKGQVLLAVTKYAGAAERSRSAALHELERRQAARRGAQVALPIAVDVTVSDAREGASSSSGG